MAWRLRFLRETAVIVAERRDFCAERSYVHKVV